jgi:hypothetical protein
VISKIEWKISGLSAKDERQKIWLKDDEICSQQRIKVSKMKVWALIEEM